MALIPMGLAVLASIAATAAAAAVRGPRDRWIETLLRPKRCHVVDVPIEMDDGHAVHFEGFRVQHSLTRGPGKGGVRYHPDVTLEEVMALAA